MANDYINAEGMYQNQNSVPNNPFWSGYQGGKFQQQAQPFIDMQKQNAAYDLQKKAMETGEFTGQEAQTQRSMQRQSDTATSQYNIDTRPTMAEHEKKRLREEIRALPSMTDQKIAQARQATMTAEGMPHRELLAEIGSSYDTLSGLPEQERPRAWDSMVQRWQATHPGAQLPDSFRQYSPEHLADAGAIRYNQLNSPEQIGKERITDMQQTGETTRANMAGEYGNIRANIAADAHIRGAQMHVNAAETPPKAEARLRRELRANPGNEDARQELLGYTSERFKDKFEKDGYAQMLRIQALNDQNKMKDYLVYREQEKARLFMDEPHLYGDISSEGRDWVMRAIKANPNAGMENVIKMGRQLGKLGKGK